jgi:hypothetical protein
LLALEDPAYQFRCALCHWSAAPLIGRDLTDFLKILRHVPLQLLRDGSISDGQVHFIVDSEGSVVEVRRTHNRPEAVNAQYLRMNLRRLVLVSVSLCLRRGP